MPPSTVEEILRTQDGVISRRQAHAAGMTDAGIQRRLRRREWSCMHPGVYVEHNGPPTAMQAAWAAVLYYWPAALAGESALAIQKVRGYDLRPGLPVEVIVDRDRRVLRRGGIVVRQRSRFESLCQMQLDPPRQRLEHAALDVASRKRGLGRSVGVVADIVQQGRATPRKLLEALDERPRLRHRALLRCVLGDVTAGVRSVLEHRYLVDVERAHGLPTGVRQRRVQLDGSPSYRDVDYVEFGFTLELDGRIGHSGAEDKWSDLERDVSSLAAGDRTLRAGWIHVLDPCRLALAVAQVLRSLGWSGWVVPCSSDCGAFFAPGEENARQTG